MDKKEVRIGNWVYAFKTTYQIDETDFGGELIKTFKPLPLTEEWLLKFGYKKLIQTDFPYFIYFLENDNFDGQFIVRFYRDDIDIAPFSKSPLKGKDVFQSISIQYVHQLQNLYSALTGEELTLKEI